MEEIVLYKALYNYSPSDDELTEGYIAMKTDDVLEVKKSAQFEAECEGNIQVTRPCLPEHDSMFCWKPLVSKLRRETLLPHEIRSLQTQITLKVVECVKPSLRVYNKVAKLTMFVSFS